MRLLHYLFKKNAKRKMWPGPVTYGVRDLGRLADCGGPPGHEVGEAGDPKDAPEERPREEFPHRLKNR